MEGTVTTVDYQVPSIRCRHCVATIQREVGEVQGVSRVVADEASKKVSITFDPPATEGAIISLMNELGYPVKR